jgi:hypothetical protein
MDRSRHDTRPEPRVALYGRAAVLVVVRRRCVHVGALGGRDRAVDPDLSELAADDAVDRALSLAALGAAILMQSGHPSPERVRAARAVAAAVAVLAVIFFAEYATAGSFGLDQVWFGEAVRRWQASWPGCPSPQTASSLVLAAAAAALIRVDRWTRAVWPLCMAGGATIPFTTVAAYLFDAVAPVGATPSTGQAISTASALLLLIAATLGGSLQRWTGLGFGDSIHPDDRGKLARALLRIASGESVLQRFWLRSADAHYHWVDGHGKPYVDAQGRPDGLIAALRIVDDQVEASSDSSGWPGSTPLPGWRTAARPSAD